MTDTAPVQTTQEEKGSRRMTIGLILVSVTLAAVADNLGLRNTNFAESLETS